MVSQRRRVLDLNGEHESQQDDRPTRGRKKKFSRCGATTPQDEDIQCNSLENSQDKVTASDRFSSLIMAKRIKNENSRML